jgi:hypothetical protein
MKWGKFNPYPILILAWMTIWYDALAGIYDWRLWIPVAVVFIERVFVQFVLAHTAHMASQLINQLKLATERLQGGNPHG